MICFPESSSHGSHDSALTDPLKQTIGYTVMNSSPALQFLSPAHHLPAEGFDAPSPQEVSENALLQLYREMMKDCELGFVVDENGVAPLGDTPEEMEFVTLGMRFSDSEPVMEAGESPIPISLSKLDESADAFDGCESPDEYLRAFVEWIGPNLSKATESQAGDKTPILYWSARDEGEGIQVQFLGMLNSPLGDDTVIQGNADGQWIPLFDDPEVEAHGLREMAVGMAIVAFTLGGATEAEAGPFKNLFKKRDTVPIQQANYQRSSEKQAIQRVATTSGYQDVHRDARINQRLLSQGTSANSRIVVDVAKQRAYLIVNNQVAIDTAVSTARSGKYTPRGTFKITQRVEQGKTSTIYGCALPYWMRLDQSAIGMHVGDLPGYPASAGCIRLPHSVAPLMFQNTQSGTTVQVTDNFNLASLSGPGEVLVASN